MLENARKRHFRNADTSILEAQFADPSIPAPDEDVKPFGSPLIRYPGAKQDRPADLRTDSSFNRSQEVYSETRDPSSPDRII